MKMKDQSEVSTASKTAHKVKDNPLSEDLLMEIFHRLPAKSLSRFKCVSKGWRQLISSDSLQRKILSSMTGFFYHFCAVDHTDHSHLEDYKYTRVSDDDNSGDFSTQGINISLAFLPCYPNFRIIHSCGGLLLCLSERTKQANFYVCNPLTRRWTALPKPLNNRWCQNAKLIPDPQSPTHFQVVTVADQRNVRRSYTRLHTYCSDTGKWFEWELHTEPLEYSPKIHDAVVFEGALYALALPSHLVRINIKERSLAVMELTQMISDQGILGTSENYVYFLQQSKYPMQQIWVLKDWDANEWILKYVFGDMATVALEKGALCRLHPYHCHGHFQFHLVFHSEFELIILRTQCQLFAYHLNSRKVEAICSLRCDPDVPSCSCNDP